VTITLNYGPSLAPQFKALIDGFAETTAAATQAATQRAATEIEDQGRENIRAAGSSARLQDGFHAVATDTNITVTHDAPFWLEFEEGRVIQGRPLLWIPLSFATEAQGVRARDFPSLLRRVDRARKAPLLMAAGARPMYFGKQTITIQKKWNLRDIVRRVADQMNQFYKEALRSG
jgi:hypothetical protein